MIEEKNISKFKMKQVIVIILFLLVISSVKTHSNDCIKNCLVKYSNEFKYTGPNCKFNSTTIELHAQNLKSVVISTSKIVMMTKLVDMIIGCLLSLVFYVSMHFLLLILIPVKYEQIYVCEPYAPPAPQTNEELVEEPDQNNEESHREIEDIYATVDKTAKRKDVYQNLTDVETPNEIYENINGIRA